MDKERAKMRNEDNAYYDKQAMNYIQFLVNSPNAKTSKYFKPRFRGHFKSGRRRTRLSV
jgi:hypothetical protein